MRAQERLLERVLALVLGAEHVPAEGQQRPVAASSARRASSSLPTRRRTSGARIACADIWSLTYPPLTSAGVGQLSSVVPPKATGVNSQATIRRAPGST